MGVDLVSVMDAIWNGARAANLESVTLDFKTVGRSIGDSLRDLAEAAACFANAQGGSIVVGVQDFPGARVPFRVAVSRSKEKVRRAIKMVLTLAGARHDADW